MDELKEFVDENLEAAFVQYKKACATSTKYILEGYIQGLEEIMEFIEDNQ